MCVWDESCSRSQTRYPPTLPSRRSLQNREVTCPHYGASPCLELTAHQGNGKGQWERRSPKVSAKNVYSNPTWNIASMLKKVRTGCSVTLKKMQTKNAGKKKPQQCVPGKRGFISIYTVFLNRGLVGNASSTISTVCFDCLHAKFCAEIFSESVELIESRCFKRDMQHL